MSAFRVAIIRALLSLLLPRDVWVGKHFGGYTQKWGITFGKLDHRGVMQGYDPKEPRHD